MKHIYVLLSCAFMLAMWTSCWLLAGYAPALIIGSASTVGFICWLRFSYQAPAEPMLIAPLFLITVASLMVHVMEEYYTDFPCAMSKLFNLHFPMSHFIALTMQMMPMVAILTTLGLLYRNELANYIAWFMFIGMGFLEATHFIFPIIEGGPYHYFPGMYTAILPIIAGNWSIRKLVSVYRAQKKHS